MGWIIKLHTFVIYFLLKTDLMCSQRIEFRFSLKNQISQHLINNRFRKFTETLQNYILGPDGDCLREKNSYEIIMQELLLPLHQSFVVLESVLADHVLVPQCRRHYTRAFVLEYKVLRKKLLGLDLQEQLKLKAEYALEKINNKKYAAFAVKFLHVKEIVKIGLAFYNRSKVVLSRQIDYVNKESSSSETSEIVDSQYDYNSDWE